MKWKWLRRLKRSLYKIHLVDRCLMVFMVVLMTQSAYGLFTCEAATSETNSIDAVARTSAAAIFGYFVSANFIRSSGARSPSDTQAAGALLPPPDPPAQSRPIGFEQPAAQEELTLGATGPGKSKEESTETPARHLQILVTTAVGLSSLVILLIYRNFRELVPAAAATLSQLRDFVSGCVGFLIGCNTGDEDTR